LNEAICNLGASSIVKARIPSNPLEATSFLEAAWIEKSKLFAVLLFSISSNDNGTKKERIGILLGYQLGGSSRFRVTYTGIDIMGSPASSPCLHIENGDN
jgi:hypothetical protein